MDNPHSSCGYPELWLQLCHIYRMDNPNSSAGYPEW